MLVLFMVSLSLQMLCKNESNKREKIRPQKAESEEELEDEVEDAVQKVCNATGCSVSILSNLHF